jgi:hypothetical protein
MWHNLANIALLQQNLRVAQRCYAALGSASKTFYIGEMLKIEEKYEELNGPGVCPEILARLALLGGDLRFVTAFDYHQTFKYSTLSERLNVFTLNKVTLSQR